MILITCTTLFDITATGVRSHQRTSPLPFTHAEGQLITTDAELTRARNQQRNWDTINQVIALRCLPQNICTPVRSHKDAQTAWMFSFELDNISGLASDTDAFGILKKDAQGVPMIVGLDEGPIQSAWLDFEHHPNIWFEINNAYERNH